VHQCTLPNVFSYDGNVDDGADLSVGQLERDERLDSRDLGEKSDRVKKSKKVIKRKKMFLWRK
jgi:hypothetical protein